jgi:hypothetical protein
VRPGAISASTGCTPSLLRRAPLRDVARGCAARIIRSTRGTGGWIPSALALRGAIPLRYASGTGVVAVKSAPNGYCSLARSHRQNGFFVTSGYLRFVGESTPVHLPVSRPSTPGLSTDEDDVLYSLSGALPHAGHKSAGCYRGLSGAFLVNGEAFRASHDFEKFMEVNDGA